MFTPEFLSGLNGTQSTFHSSSSDAVFALYQILHLKKEKKKQSEEFYSSNQRYL